MWDRIDVDDSNWAYKNFPFAGELYLGHLRYGTFGKNSIDFVHPVMRQNNWKSRNLVLAANFNLTNTDSCPIISITKSPDLYSSGHAKCFVKL